MVNLDRRQFLAAGGLGVGGLALTLAGCSSAATAPHTTAAAKTAKGTITWWDQFQPLQKLEQSTFDAYSKKHAGVSVKYTVYDPNNLSSALQLAEKSNQLPDVFTNALGVPDLGLVQNKWVAPIELTVASKKAIGEQNLLDGLHTFKGKVYTFPMFTYAQHSTLNYFNKDLVEKAGGDPDAGPKTWDGFRSLARKMTKNGGGSVYGWIEGLMLTDRMRAHVIDLASGAGAHLSFVQNSADSPGVADARTGEYVFDSEPFLDTFEFLHSLVEDKVMFPSSTSLDVRTARARWAAGVGGMFFDGPWNVGVLNTQFEDFVKKTGVTNMPTPSGKVAIANGPTGGVFWVSSTSSNVDVANEILNQFTTADYAAGLAKNMDQPPANLDAVKHADVPSVYKKSVALMSDTVSLAPSAIVKNPNVAAVLAEMKEIRPTLGEITQGYLGGNISNIKSALTKYQSDLSAERERAMKVVNAQGKKTSLDDWIFTNAKVGTDYDSSKYAS
jgi:multiple sugar transport system substrate-binding protein